MTTETDNENGVSPQRSKGGARRWYGAARGLAIAVPFALLLAPFALAVDAYTPLFVVAVAAANARVGVDVESIDRDLSEEFASGVFMPEELELAAQAANASQAVIKFWCAKEALSKALGTGIRYSPREMTVTDYLSDAGVLTLRLSGAWSDAFKNFRGRGIRVTVKTVRNHALASCFIPSSLFDE